MHVLVSGSRGLIGAEVTKLLTSNGHKVTGLVRRLPEAGRSEVFWDPDAGRLEERALEGLDAVVHLAGENIAGRWTARKKKRIRESRVQGTQLLCARLAALGQPPKTLLCASAMGIYGNRGADRLDEESAPGSDFLAGVCQEWEAATEPAAQRGLRVARLRFGVVLSPRGGALAKLLLPFKLGLGGVVGSGEQYWSWIALDDVAGAISHALATGSLAGAVNVASPHPETNREFTRVLGRVLGRPTLFPMPAFAARLAFGEMAGALLLGSTRVEPKRLLASGFAFQFPQLEEALRHLLGK